MLLRGTCVLIVTANVFAMHAIRACLPKFRRDHTVARGYHSFLISFEGEPSSHQSHHDIRDRAAEADISRISMMGHFEFEG